MSGNTSATGGPLQPVPSGPAPLEGEALFTFLQGWLVGVSGLPGASVTWNAQAEEPNIPTTGNAWVTFAITSRPADTFPAIIHQPAGNDGAGQDLLRRQQTLELMVSVYDLGSGATAQAYADLINDGVIIPQNTELLQLSGYGLQETRSQVIAPVLTKGRWLYRVDLPIVLTRAIRRLYPVENILSATGTIVAAADRGLLTEIVTAA